MTSPPEPPPYEPDLDAIIGIEQYTDDIRTGERSFVVWDHAVWHRTYREAREGGFDGYRTVFPPRRQLPCDMMEKAVRRPDLADEIRQLSRT